MTVGIAPKSPCVAVYLSPSTLLVWMHRSMCKTESREAMSLFHRETELFKGNYQAISVFKKAEGLMYHKFISVRLKKTR